MFYLTSESAPTDSVSSSEGFIAQLLKQSYGGLQQVMVYNLVVIAGKLFSRGFISEETQRHMTAEGISNDVKADELTRQCCQYITFHSDPEGKLNELLQILEVEPVASSVVGKIQEVSNYNLVLSLYLLFSCFDIVSGKKQFVFSGEPWR